MWLNTSGAFKYLTIPFIYILLICTIYTVHNTIAFYTVYLINVSCQ